MLTNAAPIAFIPTNNAEAARKFYETTLGLTFESDDNFAMVFRVGESKTMLRIVRTGEFTPAPFTIFGWESNDIESTVKALAAKDIDFLRFSYFEQDKLGIWTAPNGNKVAWFKDPDGNTSRSHSTDPGVPIFATASSSPGQRTGLCLKKWQHTRKRTSAAEAALPWQHLRHG